MFAEVYCDLSMTKQSNFLSGFLLEQIDQRVRQSLIVRIASAGSLNFLAGCFFLVEPRDITICLLGFVACLLLAGIAHFFGALELAAHSFIVLSFVSLAVLVSRSGGINSPGIVWMPTVPIVALLLINLRWSVVWLIILVLHNVGQFIAVQNLWISADVSAATMTPLVTLWTKLNVAIVLILILYWYEMRHRDKIARLAARTQALTELQSSLHQTRKQIDALVSALESQLRLPMQRIGLLAPITQLDASTVSLTEDDRPVVAQASSQLLALVDELGDLAKFESDQLVLSKSAFDVQEAIANAVLTFKARNPGSDALIQWTTDQATPPWAMGDGARLSRVVADLLSQSIGGVKNGESLQVRAAVNGTLLAIEIPQVQALELTSDSLGRALENADVAQTIDANNPVDLQKRGLQERLVAMAGGRIAYTRNAEGRVLRLEWPIPALAEPGFANQATKDALRQALRVMLIGGQASLQFEMQQVLRKLFGDCEFGVADSGETALIQLNFGNFNLVLIELHSPEVDALELTRRIRTHTKAYVHGLTVIGLGNAMLVPQRQHYLDAGMQWVIYRPWTTDTLFRAISAQLR